MQPHYEVINVGHVDSTELCTSLSVSERYVIATYS